MPKPTTLLSLLLAVVGTSLAATSAAHAQCDRIPFCELVWSDEFDGTEVDTSKWEFQLGTGTDYGLPAGWGNNELQYYQRQNASVADGFLTITARSESVSGSSYTSARMRTLGNGDFTYGRIEARARMPIGKGMWAAVWMLPTDALYGGWAASGEIDIVENLGSEPERVHGTIHFGSPWPRNTSRAGEYDLPDGRFHDGFHVFAIEWERGEIRWYVDDVLYATQTEWFSSGGPFPAPFDADFHILLNLAVGGNWPGSPDSTTTFPQELVVDYVRVYQSGAAKGTQAATAGLLFDKQTRMKKIQADLSTAFENRARTRDAPGDERTLDCSVRARGKKGVLTASGSVRVALVGSAGGRAWTGSSRTAGLDASGHATFSTAELDALVAEAAGAGAAVERMSITFKGTGRAKVTGLDVDCWQRPAG